MPKVPVFEDAEEEEPPFPEMAREDVEAAFQCFSDLFGLQIFCFMTQFNWICTGAGRQCA